MNDIKRGIQYAFQSENNMTIAMSGSGHAAMECAVFNTVEPGESVLIAVNGIWGERVAEIAERMGTSLRTVLRTDLLAPSKRITQVVAQSLFVFVSTDLDTHLSTNSSMYSFIFIDLLFTEIFNKKCQIMFVLSLGANVHRMLKAPGGYFSNKEIEQVETLSV